MRTISMLVTMMTEGWSLLHILGVEIIDTQQEATCIDTGVTGAGQSQHRARALILLFMV